MTYIDNGYVGSAYISIDPVTLIPSCSDCGMPVPKTVAEVVLTISRWPIICSNCKRGAHEIRYTPSATSYLSIATR